MSAKEIGDHLLQAEIFDYPAPEPPEPWFTFLLGYIEGTLSLTGAKGLHATMKERRLGYWDVRITWKK